MIIYKTTNLINGKFYIGQDSGNNPKYIGSGLLLTKAIKKYGRENFKKEVLEFCTNKEELNNKEKFWISFLSATTIGYNIAEGGAGGDLFNCLTEEQKIKNIEIKSINAKSKNIMHNKNVFECWVDKYGFDVANEKLIDYKQKLVLTQKENFLRKKEKIKKDYGDFIIKSFGKMTIDEIHKELSGVSSKRTIRDILKEAGVNTYSRKGLNKGTKNGQSKLNCDDVKNIIFLSSTNKPKDLAIKYNMSLSQIHHLLNGKTYKDCYDPPYQKGNDNLKEYLKSKEK